VAGAGQVVRLALRIDGFQDSARPVQCGDAGGNAFARVDGFAKRRSEIGGIARRHQRQAERVAPFRGKRETDQPAAVRGHEIDDFRRDFFGRDGEIAFVFAVLIVDYYHHASGADIVDGFRDRDKGHDSL
jgi:hypothetical protein